MENNLIKMSEQNKNLILELTLEFALNIIDFCEILEENKKFVIAKQLLKSGTSIGANVREAQSSESKADFIHKIKVAEKEAEETEYWLLLCKQSKNYIFDENLFEKLISIKKVLSKILTTAKTNQLIH
jgi:four helix bundle protein